MQPRIKEAALNSLFASKQHRQSLAELNLVLPRKKNLVWGKDEGPVVYLPVGVGEDGERKEEKTNMASTGPG